MAIFAFRALQADINIACSRLTCSQCRPGQYDNPPPRPPADASGGGGGSGGGGLADGIWGGALAAAGVGTPPPAAQPVTQPASNLQARQKSENKKVF